MAVLIKREPICNYTVVWVKKHLVIYSNFIIEIFQCILNEILAQHNMVFCSVHGIKYISSANQYAQFKKSADKDFAEN
jgi:hypothetical protein